MGEISFSSMGLILFAKSLDIILYKALQSEIGLNISKELGLTYLGIKERKVELLLPLTLALW